MWRKGWENYQAKQCKSASFSKSLNRTHYNRILDSLTDNRSIDILNQASLRNIKKIDPREYIIKYVQENNGTKSIQKMVADLAVALDIPPNDSGAYRAVYDAVVQQMQDIFDTTNSMLRAPRHIDIAVDGETVGIEASSQGVVATANPMRITGVASTHVDEESGDRVMTTWAGDNQAPVRAFAFGGLANQGLSDSGDRVSSNPSQFSVPTSLPPQMNPIVFNRQAVPDTNELETQTDITGTYPNAQFALQMKPFSPTSGAYPTDPIRTRYVYGGAPLGRPNATELFYQFGDENKSRRSSQTNTLLTGPTGEMRETGIGRPPMQLMMDYSGAEGSGSEATFATASTGGSFSVLGGPSRPSTSTGDIRKFFAKP